MLKRDYYYEFIYLLFRKVLCHFGIHNHECQDVGRDYALLYCLYCLRGKKAYTLKKETDAD